MKDHLALANRGLMLFGLVLLSLSAGALSYDTARASHYRYLVEDSSFNPGGSWSYTVGNWVIGNDATPSTPQVITWCNNLGGYSTETSGAISDWENALSGLTQYSSVSCGSAALKFVWGSCNPGAWACMVYTWTYDGSRLSNYITGGELRLVSSATTWDAVKVREVVRHELGHFMGLNEHYLHTSPLSCNPNGILTIMDLAPGTYFGCGDGTTVTSADVSSVTSEYGLSSVTSLIGWNCSSYYGGIRTFCINWYDDEPANSYTYSDLWRCADSACSSGSNYVRGGWHKPGSGLYNASNSTYFTSLSSAYYWAGVSHYSAASGLGPKSFTGIVSVP